MIAEQPWIPETVTNLLNSSEIHYRSIGFRRVASLMTTALRSCDSGPVSPSFYPKYVRCLTDDSSQLIRSFGFPKSITEYFMMSMSRSIRLVEQILAELDSTGRTPTFNGTTSKIEDEDVFRRFFSTIGLIDPMKNGPDPLGILESAEPFFEMVYEHSYKPGKEYLVSQLDLALGHERMLTVSEEVLSVEKTVIENAETISDFRYAQTRPGDLSENGTAWKVLDDFEVPIERFSRWAYFMYYKIPILSAMLPIHNITFFSLVQETIDRRRSDSGDSSV